MTNSEAIKILKDSNATLKIQISVLQKGETLLQVSENYEELYSIAESNRALYSVAESCKAEYEAVEMAIKALEGEQK